MPSLIILGFQRKKKKAQKPTENSQIFKTHTFYFCDFWIVYSIIFQWFMGLIKLFTEILENIS